jgi:lipopolysaccharide export system permease protein
MKAALYNIATSNPIAMFGSDQIIDQFPGYLIYVEKKNGTRLENILMYQVNERGELMTVVRAKSGELIAELEGKPQILLHLENAQYEQRDAQKPDNFMLIQEGITSMQSTFVISLEALYEKNIHKRSPTQMGLTELLYKESLANSSMDRQQASALRTEANKRFSFSLASFAFCLIGVPLAITAHRKETSIGFLFSLIVAFVYFFFIVMVDTVRTNPKFHPEILIWMPNVIFIALGAYLFRRMSRR